MSLDDKEYLQLGDELYHVLIPEHYPMDLKLMVLAALKTFRLGKKSMDHVLRKYSDAWADQFDILCEGCGRRVRIRVRFKPLKDDFILKCSECGHFFCKRCLAWQRPTNPDVEQAWGMVNMRCKKCMERDRRNIVKNPFATTSAPPPGLAEVILLDSKRKKD